VGPKSLSRSCGEEKTVPSWASNPGRRARSLVTVLTELSSVVLHCTAIAISSELPTFKLLIYYLVNGIYSDSGCAHVCCRGSAARASILVIFSYPSLFYRHRKYHVFSLFNVAFSVTSNSTEGGDKWMVNCKGCGRKRSWPNFKLISRHSPGGTHYNYEYLSQHSRSPGLDLNPGNPECEAGVLTTHPRRSMVLMRNLEVLIKCERKIG
jgi:hypothetical protein